MMLDSKLFFCQLLALLPVLLMQSLLRGVSECLPEDLLLPCNLGILSGARFKALGASNFDFYMRFFIKMRLFLSSCHALLLRGVS